MSEPTDSAFERRSRERLLESAQRLDGRVRSRLNQARHAALAEAAGSATRFRVPGYWLPSGTLAAAAVLAIAVWIAQPNGVAPTTAEVSPVEDIEILASNDGPDLYQDDAAFYEWAGADANGEGETT